MSKEVGEEYLSSLSDLNVNSKPLINMLTILAEENIQHAAVIVEAIEQHLAKVNPDVKLPILYLVDSIVKNVGEEYKTLFSQCIVRMFCGVFEKVNEKVREKLFALRQTWADVFPQSKLCKLDIKVSEIDPGWPIVTQASSKSPAIHVNPNFFKPKDTVLPQVADDVQVQLREKHKKLLELQRKKLELELVATKKEIEKQEREITNLAGQSGGVGVLPEVAGHSIPIVAATKIAPVRSLIHVNPAPMIPGQIATVIPPIAEHVNHAVGQKIRVAPVNAALLNMARSRDPRLARKQIEHQQHQNHINQQSLNLINFNRNKNDINFNNNNTLSNPIQLTNVSSSMNDMDNVINPGSVILNKNTLPKIPKFSKQNNNRQNHVNTSNIQKIDSLPKKNSNIKSSPSKTSLSSSKSKPKIESLSKSSNSSGKSKDNKTSSSHGSSSDEKKKSRRRSPSPERERRREMSPKRGNSEGRTKYNSKSPTPTKSSRSTMSPSNSKFKELKPSTKSRNYMRKNREISKSPSPPAKSSQPSKDIDLRIIAKDEDTKSTVKIEISSKPPIPQLLKQNDALVISTINEKQEKVKDEKPEIKVESNIIEAASRDVDLRLLPSTLSTPSSIASNVESSPDSKKRHIIPELKDEPQLKKSKTEKLDELFGSEDVDLRTIPTSSLKSEMTGIRPITPPPPVISNETIDSTSWAKIKGDGTKKLSTPRSSLDAVRAKLSEVSKKVKTDSPPDSKIINRSLSKERDLKKKYELLLNDETSQEGNDANIKIMMAQAQEQLNNKNIDIEEYGTMMKQIFVINESKKIREAERREYMKRKSDSWQQIDLTPISDDEIGFSSGSDETENPEGTKKQRKAERRERLRFKKKKMEENDKKSNAGTVIPQTIESSSSFAQSTAAELRNDHKDGRWSNQKVENNARWASPWEQTSTNIVQPTAVSGPIQSGTWNLHTGLINQPPPQTIPGISSFGNNSMSNPWQNIPFVQPQIIPPILPQPTQMDLLNQNDVVRTINIDQIPREIRFYDDIAIAFMNWDEPKEIGFQSGKRRVIVDDKDTIILGFNEPNKTFTIDGKNYEIRFGSPTRELYIDNKWYECFFGDPPIAIPLENKVRIFKVDGPPPPVKIGNLRQDLVVGKINLIIDARNMVPVFLDSKLQYFEIDGQINTLQFADYLLTVLINNEPFSVEFGGLPKSLYVRGKKHFVRFTALPNGIVPGKVYIRNMNRTDLHREVASPPAPAIVCLNDVPVPDSSTEIKDTIDKNISNIPVTPVTTSSTSSLPVSFDFLTNLLPKPTSTTTSFDSYNVDSTVQTGSTSLPLVNQLNAVQPQANSLLGNVNIDDLYQKLLASGILSKQQAAAAEVPKDDKKSKEKERITPVDLSQSETIKTRQAAIVNQLFSGMQCSSCGVRFPPEQTMKYSQHLDWHFRQNRRDRDSARRAHSRRWYYDVSDWIQYEEIEDIEEREKNWFETQQTEIDLGQDDSNHKSDSPPPSCPAGPNDVDKTCDMCHDKFEQFYNEENEEWHLRAAIKLDDKTYHPLCYEDYKASLTLDESTLNITTKSQDDSIIEIKDIKVKVEKSENTKEDDAEEDDDDVVEVIPLEPVITEIFDEDEDMSVENVTESTESKNKSQEEDPDVEIQEPNIPVTDLDEIEDLPNAAISIDDTELSQGGSPFTMIKIKEEPKEDEEDEEDAFEDVGTVCDIADIDDEESIVHIGENTTDPTNSILTSNDHPKENAVQPSSNRIKINITKTINKNINQNITASLTSANNSEGNSTTGADGSSCNKKITEIEEKKEEEIEFVFKENLKNIKFNKVGVTKNGYETSGLCSIM